MTDHDADGPCAPDEHGRFARYLQDLAVVRDEDEADLVVTVLRDPDTTMAQSALVRHLDNRAAQLLPLSGGRFGDWSRAMTMAIGDLDFLARRLHEWNLLRSITMAEPLAAKEVTTASDWFQHKAAETATSPAVLAVLAAVGRTRRIRAAASRRLHR